MTGMVFALLGLVVLHIAVVVAKELRHGGNLISGMFTGRKTWSPAYRRWLAGMGAMGVRAFGDEHQLLAAV